MKQVYDLCTEGQTRNQEGVCLDEAQWQTFCESEVSICTGQISTAPYIHNTELRLGELLIHSLLFGDFHASRYPVEDSFQI